MSGYFQSAQYMPCPDCGASVERTEADDHVSVTRNGRSATKHSWRRKSSLGSWRTTSTRRMAALHSGKLNNSDSTTPNCRRERTRDE